MGMRSLLAAVSDDIDDYWARQRIPRGHRQSRPVSRRESDQRDTRWPLVRKVRQWGISAPGIHISQEAGRNTITQVSLAIASDRIMQLSAELWQACCRIVAILNMRRLTPLDTQSIIAELEAERDRLNSALAALQSSQGKRGGTASGKPYGRRRHLSAAARRKIGLAMKKRWAERKKKAAA
jgi:hypothetical protein